MYIYQSIIIVYLRVYILCIWCYTINPNNCSRIIYKRNMRWVVQLLMVYVYSYWHWLLRRLSCPPTVLSAQCPSLIYMTNNKSHLSSNIALSYYIEKLFAKICRFIYGLRRCAWCRNIVWQQNYIEFISRASGCTSHMQNILIKLIRKISMSCLNAHIKKNLFI